MADSIDCEVKAKKCQIHRRNMQLKIDSARNIQVMNVSVEIGTHNKNDQVLNADSLIALVVVYIYIYIYITL